MKVRRKRVRITTRTQEVLIVRDGGQLSEEKCPVCGSPFPRAASRPGTAAQAEAGGEGLVPPALGPPQEGGKGLTPPEQAYVARD